jgi:hypothetical protein
VSPRTSPPQWRGVQAPNAIGKPWFFGSSHFVTVGSSRVVPGRPGGGSSHAARRRKWGLDWDDPWETMTSPKKGTFFAPSNKTPTWLALASPTSYIGYVMLHPDLFKCVCL